MTHTKWVCGWGASTSVVAQTTCDYFRDMTFRYRIFPTLDASAIRIHISNRFGHEPITLTEATVAAVAERTAIRPETLRAITFNGRANVTLAPGNEVVSDPVDFPVRAGEEIAVSNYFADLTEYYTGHTNSGPFIFKYMTHGNHTHSAELPLVSYNASPSYVGICAVDFLTDESAGAIIAFGDSITAQPWPDFLARRIFDLGIRNRAVVRKGIGGNRVLREYTHRAKKHFGPRGIDRFARDIAQAGADRVFILHGINDLIHPGSEFSPADDLPTADELIAGLKYYIEAAHQAGLKIYMSPILPCGYCTRGDGHLELIRAEVNAWIRSCGLHDGVLDFEAAVLDPENPLALKSEYDSGDHLHPSRAGAQQMANSIPVDMLL